MRRKKRVMVTGGAGFVGSHIAKRLLNEGVEVIVVDNLFTGREENIPEAADFIKLDLGDEGSYGRLKNVSCDAILHLAGQSSGETSFKDPLYDLKSHLMSTFLLLDWCRRNNVRRFLYASSMAVYGDPEYLPVDEDHPLQPKTFYASAKISAEAYLKLYQGLGIDTTVFRLFSVYGPGQNLDNKSQGMASIYLSYLLKNTPIIVKGPKERFRDFVYIDDVVDAWMAALKDPVTHGKLYNLASGVKTTVKDLIKALCLSFGDENYPVEYKEGTPGDQFGIVGDNRRIFEEIKWRPKISLGAGLKMMVNYEKRKNEI